jgi:Beta-ketoacyl synthase, N-terminal domain
MMSVQNKIFLERVGLFATGFRNWSDALPILRGESPYVQRQDSAPQPSWLPPAERRRTSDIIRLALEAGRDCLEDSVTDLAEANTVFASSGGSGEVIHQICESLATEDREVSPTRFHNSVHNAPAGYWGIATRNEWPSTSLCGHDASFSVGFVEAVAQARQIDRSVLLLVHDLSYPEPLNSVRNVHGQFSVALLLRSSRSSQSQCSITASLHPSRAKAREEALSEWPDLTKDLEFFRLNNPAARCLPLLVTLARAETRTLHLNHTPGSELRLEVQALG